LKILDFDILGLSQVAGVSITYTSQTEYSISFCLLQKKRGEISIVNSAESLDRLEEIKTLLPKGIPVVLNISGKIILNKEFPVDTDEKDRVLPVNQPDDFYIYEVEADTTIGISISRKSVIEDFLVEFASLGISVINLSIGPYSASNLWSYELVEDTNIPVGVGNLCRNEIDNRVEYRSSVANREISISEQAISGNLVLSYTNALISLLKGNPGEFSSDRPEKLVDGYQFKQIISKTKYLVLGVVFLILIINFLTFDSLRKKEAQITGQLQLNSGILAKRDSLETILRVKESFIEYIGNNKTYYSYFLDEIAATVPSKITLSKLDINPLDGKIQKKEAIKVQRKIVIAGVAGSSLILNQWINKLENLEWTKEVIVLNYSRNEESGKGEFLVELEIKK
jgi:Tfp pilus assembly protein PilN